MGASIVNGDCQPTCNWGAPPCRVMYIFRVIGYPNLLTMDIYGYDQVMHIPCNLSVVPFGKLTVCHGKPPFLLGKATINGHVQ